MELTAILMAVDMCPGNANLLIETDSKLAIGLLTGGWKTRHHRSQSPFGSAPVIQSHYPEATLLHTCDRWDQGPQPAGIFGRPGSPFGKRDQDFSPLESFMYQLNPPAHSLNFASILLPQQFYHKIKFYFWGEAITAAALILSGSTWRRARNF